MQQTDDSLLPSTNVTGIYHQYIKEENPYIGKHRNASKKSYV